MIDPITIFVSSLSLPWLTSLAIFLDKYGYPIMAVLFLLAFWRLKEKRKLLVLTMLFAVIATLGFKLLLDVQRPCHAGVVSKIPCPNEASFPSGHSLAGFGLASASIGTIAAYALWPFAVLIAFTRLYLGVHTIVDILGAFVLGFVCYGLALVVEKRFLRTTKAGHKKV